MNKVTAGDYKGSLLSLDVKTDQVYIAIDRKEKVFLNKTTILEYNVIDSVSRTSATSAVGRAAIGAALLGPVGLIAGASAKKKGEITLEIVFKNGKRSLIEINDKYYKVFSQTMF